MKSPLPIVALTFLICGCGPVYHTDYSFIPPHSSGGQACVYQCENGRYQCRQIEDLRVERCRDYAYQQQRDCEARIRWDKDRKPKWYECGSESCSADYDSCDQQYRFCYQGCGGEVKASTRCVSNCDKIPPGQFKAETKPKASSLPKKPQSASSERY